MVHQWAIELEQAKIHMAHLMDQEGFLKIREFPANIA
jgi:hypothetical protein